MTTLTETESSRSIPKTSINKNIDAMSQTQLEGGNEITICLKVGIFIPILLSKCEMQHRAFKSLLNKIKMPICSFKNIIDQKVS